MQKWILILIGIIILVLMIFSQTTKNKPITHTKIGINKTKIKTIKRINSIENPIKKESITKINTTEVKVDLSKVIPLFESSFTLEDAIKAVPKELEEMEFDTLKRFQSLIIEEMISLPNCLEKSKTKKEALTCSQKIRQQSSFFLTGSYVYNKELEDDFIWNEEIKVNLIKTIEKDTILLYEIQACMKSVSKFEELETCVHL